MKFIHDHVPDICLRAFAQGDIGQDFSGAAENRGVAVDGGIAGAESDVVRAEIAAEREPLFIHQGLDWAGIDGTAALGQGLEMQRRRHEGLPRTRGRVENDVFSSHISRMAVSCAE